MDDKISYSKNEKTFQNTIFMILFGPLINNLDKISKN